MKKTAALDYVEKLEECTQCNHFDLCNALTTHYLNTLKLIILNGGEL